MIQQRLLATISEINSVFAMVHLLFLPGKSQYSRGQPGSDQDMQPITIVNNILFRVSTQYVKSANLNELKR